MFYPIAIEPGTSDHTFGVVVPDIPGCFSAGDTFEDAVINAKEAIEAHLESLCEDNLDIPKASDVSSYFANPDYMGWVWALVEVDITPYLGNSQKVNVTLPEALIKRIDNTVARLPEYKSRSGFLAQAALHELGRIASN